MSHKDVIQKWFDKTVKNTCKADSVPNASSVYLPDRSFGKPGDNIRSLTSIAEKDDTLVIIFDNQHVFTFEGLEKVTQESETERGQLLILGPFRRLEVAYGSKPGDVPNQCHVYTEGEVTFGASF